MAINLHSQLPDATLHNPKGFSFASAGTKVTRDEKSELNWQPDLSLPAALSFATATSAPPTEVDGDIYVLVGGTPHGDWDGASENDWVRFDGTAGTWKAITPTSGTTTLNIASGDYKLWNGSSWVNVNGSASNFAIADLTFTGNRTHNLSGNTLTLDNGQTTVQGAGTTSATTSFLVENSLGTEHLKVFDDGKIAFGKTTASTAFDFFGSRLNDANVIFVRNSSTGVNSSSGIRFQSPQNTNVATFGCGGSSMTSANVAIENAAYMQANTGLHLTMLMNDKSKSFKLYHGGSSADKNIFQIDSNVGNTVTYFKYGFKNTAGSYYEGNRVTHQLTTETAGSEDSTMTFQTSDGGSLVTNLTLQENKVGFYTATPVARATTGGSSATFTANTSGISDDTATWGGYTIGQVVQALQNIGILT